MFSKPVIITWWTQKLSLNIFLKFQRMKYDGLHSSLFRKITELQWYYLVLLFQLYNNQIFINIFSYRQKHASCKIKKMKIPFLTKTNNFKKVRHDVRHLRKTLEYLKIQESLRSEKFPGVLFMLRL